MEYSSRSLKNKFFIQISYSKPVKGIGSVQSFSTNELSSVDSFIRRYYGCNQKKVHVVIRENIAVYPSLDWRVIDEYDLFIKKKLI